MCLRKILAFLLCVDDVARIFYKRTYRKYWVSSEKTFFNFTTSNSHNFHYYIILLFCFRILFSDIFKNCSKFFWSFLHMEFSILEHKCKDLTSQKDIFGASISRKLIAPDKYFFQYDYLRTSAQLLKMPNLSLF